MSKLRSKLKRHAKGKTWGKGHSSTSNPVQMKHRNKAQSRFFQSNLNLGNAIENGNTSGLTAHALAKHDQSQAFSAETTTVNDVASSLKSFNMNDDNEAMSESQLGTFTSFKTFASNYSSCSNVSFKKLLNGFRTSSALHKEMLAILTALTEIIKERGGSETSTEYFILLMEQIEASTEDNDIIAGVSLLSMGIKTVPVAVLRKRFSETAQTLMASLQRFMESGNQIIIRYIINCLAILLRAQDYQTWSYSSTWVYIDAILTFTLHSKPKLRKAAQHAVISILQGSTFMLPPKTNPEEEEKTETAKQSLVKIHPAGSRVVKFCLNQFKAERLANSQTSVLHTLALLKDTLSVCKTDDIRAVCEQLLSVMTAANVLIRTNCFQTLHALFVARTPNLDTALCSKLLGALPLFRPDRVDVRQTLAWLTVLKEGHIHLATLDLAACIHALPRLFEICCTDLLMSDRVELISGVINCLKELLLDCVQPACCDEETADKYRGPVTRCISFMHKVLNAPFGDVAKYIIISFCVVFQACGKHFGNELAPSLLTLVKRYDTQSSLRLQIEHAIIAAIKSMGPEYVLETLGLTNSNCDAILEKSWLLPLLREGATGARFTFFKEAILPMALELNAKWQKCSDEKPTSLKHTYELLCCQLWGLFPGFCRMPKDPENFHLIAPTLGNALANNPEFRAPIFDGITELLQQVDENPDLQSVMAKFAKNFLPRLFNVYIQKPNGSYEANLRIKCLEVIKLYMSKTSIDVLKELFDTAEKQLKETEVGCHEYEAIFDVTAGLLLLQTCETIRAFYDNFMVPVLKNETNKIVSKDESKLKRQQRKAYELLRDILTSENNSCHKFMRKNVISLQTLLLEVFATSCNVCQAARLECLKILIENRKTLTINDKIVMKTIPEAILQYKQFSTRKENIAEEIIKLIAHMYQEAGKLNDFVDILTAGFAGDESLVCNTILAFRNIVQHQGANMTIATLEFILQQISVYLVQKSRSQAEASVVFLITFIKVMPSPLVANHLENIMRSLSAMVKDTKRFCRIQIGYLLKKLCKRFQAEEITKFVPGDDTVTHRRLKKIRKEMRREERKKVTEKKDKSSADNDSDDEFISGLEKISPTIDDILADSDSDLPEDMDTDSDAESNNGKTKSKSKSETYIREDPEDIVDLADIKSIGNVLTNRPNLSKVLESDKKSKEKKPNRGFKTAEDGRLIIDEKAFRGGRNRGRNDDDDDDSDGDSSNDDETKPDKKNVKRGMEDDSSDEEPNQLSNNMNRKRKPTDAVSMRSGKSAGSRYTTGGKGIHRNVPSSDAVSMKSGYSAKSNNMATGSAYATKKAKGDMKKKGKLEPYAYLPLDRNSLNKRKRAKTTGTFKNIVNGARKGALKGVKNRIKKSYKK